MLNINNIYTIEEIKEIRETRTQRSLCGSDWERLIQDLHYYNKNITIKTDIETYSITCTKIGHNKTCNPIFIYTIYKNGNNITFLFDDCVDTKREIHSKYIKTTNSYITDKIIKKIIDNN